MPVDGIPFNAPASPERVRGLLERLGVGPGARVLDVGCGRGEMLRLLAAATGCGGLGVDRDADEVARARETARAQDLGEALSFEAASFDEAVANGRVTGPFDAALCVGATQAFGPPGEALRGALEGLRPLVRAGGRLLVGEGVWQRDPPDAYLAATGMGRDDFGAPDGLAPAAAATGWRLAHHEASSPEEWDVFEGAFLAGAEAAAQAAPDDADALARRDHWRGWNAAYRRWGRDTLGFVFAVLERGAD